METSGPSPFSHPRPSLPNSSTKHLLPSPPSQTRAPPNLSSGAQVTNPPPPLPLAGRGSPTRVRQGHEASGDDDGTPTAPTAAPAAAGVPVSGK